ncbi:tumor necrosis factor receptor superfamily member 25 [Eleutherodactylus coqui]|uniref:tumor necrosis factor receptor superfamily member 25 n=1 Tax=Eleutherodactylus coqui TaxID=57060 RepID=UPI003461B303
MKNVLCVLVLGWVHFSESVIHKHTNTLEKSNKSYNSSNADINQPFKSLQRYKRSNCDAGQFYDEKVKHCCRMCPAGQHVERSCSSMGQNPECKPCEEGTYLKEINYLTKCKRCTSCHQDTEVEQVKCSANTNAECGCKEGYFKHRENCKACTKCRNRRIINNCSATDNTQCGDCLPNFYEEKNECHPCNQSSKQCGDMNGNCSPVCKPIEPTSTVSYILTGAFLLLLLPCGGLLIYKHKRKKKHNKSHSVMGEHVFTVHEAGNVPDLTDMSQETHILCPDTPAGHVPSVLEKSCTLYDIINCVPVRRWKEFMRTLELPDKVIEAVEVENSIFRDQQYEMLRRWCQLQMPSIDVVYQTLERMNLLRCAEELKAKIEEYS